MNKQRKTSHILNVFQYDADGHVVLPASLTLGIAPAGNDNSGKVGTTAWVRTYVSGLSYQGAITLTVTGTSGAATLVGNTLNIPTYTLAGLGGQAALSGTGFVKISGTTISYDNNTYATQTYVGTQIANLVDSSPATLDTLNELAAALGDDPNFATTVATSIGTKQAQLNGTGFVKVTGTTVSYDNSTYLTTGTAGTTYVPYTGGTANVNLGVYDLDGGNININGAGSGGGALRLKQFGSSEANREGYNSISTLTSGVFYFTSSASVPNFKNFALNPSGLTDNTLRTYALPDASGTIALTSNIPTVAGVYLPLAGGTLTGSLGGTNASFSSYVTMGSLVVNDPGAAYYSYTNRIGGSTAINVNSLNVTTELGKFLSSGLSINSGGGATNNMYQISFGYKDATGVFASSAIAGITESSSGYNTGALVFATRSATTDTAPVERFRIASTGAATFTAAVTFNNNVGVNGGIIGNNSNNLYLSSNSSSGEISFWANQLSTRLMTLLTSGNLGIATASPKNKLHVQGGNVTALFSGDSTLVNEYSGIVVSPYAAQDANGLYGVEIRGTITQSTPNYLNPRMDFLVQNTNTYLPGDRGIKMTILGSGNVGFGVTNPLSRVHIQDAEPVLRIVDSSDGGVMFIGNTGGYSYIRAFSRDFKFLNAAGVSMLTIASNSQAIFGSSVSATSIRSSGVGSFAFNTGSNGEFQIYATALDGMIMAGRGSSNDMVITNKNGADVFRIPTGTTNSILIGNVGIGTSDFGTAKLNVDGSIGFAGDTTKYLFMPNVGQGTGSIYMQAGFGSATAGGALRLYGHNATSYSGGDVEVGLSGKGNFLINSYIGGARLVTVKVDGNVGINDTNPSHTLDVNGNVRFQGTTMLGSNIGLLQFGMDGTRFNAYAYSTAHIKTSILKGADTMISFNIRGYMYSPQNLDTDVAFYCYNPVSYVYGVTINHKAYSGFTVGMYYSSDNYVCIYVDGLSTYGGFALNWINTSLIQHGGRIFALAWSKTNSTAAAY